MVRLDLRELERRCHQRGTGRTRVGAATDHRDDLVDHVQRPDEALKNVQPRQGRLQPVLGTPCHHLDLVARVSPESVAQG